MTEPTITTAAMVHAQIGDLSRDFATQEQADQWTTMIRDRFWDLERMGVLALVNGNDPRWGRNGHEHMGRAREPGCAQVASLSRIFRRAGGYIGKWLTLRHEGDPADQWPLNLDGKIKDMRYAQRAPFPHPAAKTPGNWQIPPSWWVGDDGYYWHLYPDVILIASFDDWERAA